MNHLKLISLFIILICFSACEPPVSFNEPQPTDTENLSKFPKRLQGRYVSQEDSSTLTINNKSIYRTYNYYFSIHKNALDSAHRISGDTIVEINTDDKSLVVHTGDLEVRTGDSLSGHMLYTDTLFHMDYDNVVRKLKGYYFLNIRHYDNGWEVKKVQLSKGKLLISSISVKEELENLSEITETPIDTVPPHKFTPTKKQFRTFVREQGFHDSETFIRQQ